MIWKNWKELRKFWRGNHKTRYNIDGNMTALICLKIPRTLWVHNYFVLSKSIALSSSAEDELDKIWMERTYSFIVGVYQGPGKPTVEELCEPFLAELRRLDPYNDGPEFEGRRFSASLRCMRCDSPMRAFFKKCKSGMGYFGCERCDKKECKNRNYT